MKPRREQLWGFSASQFKTLLKRRGYKVPRDFFKVECVARKRNRLYRFRHWAFPNFFVDVSCNLKEFDRWANSRDKLVYFYDWYKKS